MKLLLASLLLVGSLSAATPVVTPTPAPTPAALTSSDRQAIVLQLQARADAAQLAIDMNRFTISEAKETALQMRVDALREAAALVRDYTPPAPVVVPPVTVSQVTVAPVLAPKPVQIPLNYIMASRYAR